MNQSTIKPKSVKKPSAENAVPHTDADANKDKMLNVRLTFDDYALVAENARQSGLSVSEWSRRVLTKKSVGRVTAIPRINRQAYLVLSVLAMEFSQLAKLIKRGEKFAEFRTGVIEKTLFKINLQIVEIKKQLV